MAITTSTITGQWLTPIGAPLAGAVAKIRANTADGLLRDALTGQVVAYQSRVATDGDGNLTAALPSSGIEPASPQWVIEFEPKLGISPVYFTLTGDTTWAEIVTVAEVDANQSLIVTLNGLLADLGSGYDPAGIRKALSAWFAALMNVDNAAAYAMTIGDSVSAGSISGGFTNTWRYLLQQMLRTTFPVTGVSTPGIGWVPAAIVAGEPAIPVTVTGANSVVKTDQNGAGIKALRISNNTYAEWAAQQCDRIRVWYAKRGTFAGNGEVKVDGTVKATFNSNSGGGTSDGYTADSGALTAGSHTLRVTGTSAAGIEAIVTAAEFFNGDYGKGVHIVDGAHFGANTGTFLTSEALTGHWQVAAAIKPQLYIIMLGLNDWGALTVADYLANIDSILAQCAAANGTSPYSVLIVVPYRPVKAGAPDPLAFEAMRAGLYARASSNVAVFDLGASWPDLVAGGGTETGVMYEDALPLHPNTQGHKLLARIFHRILAA